MTTVRPSSRTLPIWKTDGLRLRLMGASPLDGPAPEDRTCGVHLHHSVSIGASQPVLERVHSVQWTQRNNANTVRGKSLGTSACDPACSLSTRWQMPTAATALGRQLAGLTLLMLKSGIRSVGIAALVNQSFHSRGSVRSV